MRWYNECNVYACMYGMYISTILCVRVMHGLFVYYACTCVCILCIHVCSVSAYALLISECHHMLCIGMICVYVCMYGVYVCMYALLLLCIMRVCMLLSM